MNFRNSNLRLEFKTFYSDRKFFVFFSIYFRIKAGIKRDFRSLALKKNPEP